MGVPYDSQTSSDYNANPPSDDGSATEANRVKWATIKTKLGDPVKALADAINAELSTAFAKIVGGAGVTSSAISYQVLSTDQGKLVRATAGGITITTPDAIDVDAPFVFGVLNNGTSDITLDGSGSQTIDGQSSLTIPANAGVILYTDGSNWFTTGQNYSRTQIIPQGYLTLVPTATDGVNVAPGSDQSAKTAVYYRPDTGELVPVPDGTNITVRQFSELTLTLASQHLASNLYDVFLFNDAGTLRIGTGPAWSTPTAGSGARGTGAGTTELTRLKGLLVNAVAITARNGASTYSVAASAGLYLGTLFMDGTNGQITCHVSVGQSRKWGVWNAYNKRGIQLKVTDTTASWTGSAGWRQSNGASGNKATTLCGIAESPISVGFKQNMQQTVANSQTAVTIGIGVNSTSSASGKTAPLALTSNGSVTQTICAEARHGVAPAIGIQNINCLENGVTTPGNTTLYGGEDDMQMIVEFFA